jgi:hypothetical protein
MKWCRNGAPSSRSTRMVVKNDDGNLVEDHDQESGGDPYVGWKLEPHWLTDFGVAFHCGGAAIASDPVVPVRKVELIPVHLFERATMGA